MRHLFIIALALSCFAAPAEAQQDDPDQFVTLALKACASQNGMPSADNMDRELGASSKNFAVFCLLYNKAWSKGFHSGLGDASSERYLAFCRTQIERIASGSGSSEFQSDLNATFPDTLDRVVAAQTCSVYQEAYVAGLKKARAIVH